MLQQKPHMEPVSDINCGYLATPMQMDNVKELTDFDDWCQEHEHTGWDEYSISSSDVYPVILNTLIRLGLAFTWEYQFTEDFSYYAYNFPTEDNFQNFGTFKTGDKRKNFPRLSKKTLNQIESTSAANELLYQMGIKNGTN